MPTLRSRATAESKRSLLSRLLAPSSERITRRALGRLRNGDEAAFATFEALTADRRALALLATGEALAAEGHAPMAAEAIQRSLALEFTSTTACVLYADLTARLDRHAEGIAACRRLLAQTPGQLPVMAALAALLTGVGEAAAALGVLAEAGEDGLPLIRLREAEALLALGDPARALTLLDGVIAACEAHPDGAAKILAEAQTLRTTALGR